MLICIPPSNNPQSTAPCNRLGITNQCATGTQPKNGRQRSNGKSMEIVFRGDLFRGAIVDYNRHSRRTSNAVDRAGLMGVQALIPTFRGSSPDVRSARGLIWLM